MPTPLTTPRNGAQLVTVDGRSLPLRHSQLKAEAQGGLCRVVLTQRFLNPHSEALRVTYRMPLPADGAVSGYAFEVGGRRVVGEVDRKEKARERFEEALVEGRTAGLVEEERTSLFTQELGNIPGGSELLAELVIDQKLMYLPEGLWEWRFPTVAAPRYLGAAVADPQSVSLSLADAPLSVPLGLSLIVKDPLAEGVSPESPSHALRTSREGSGSVITFDAERGVALDRDVVVRWKARASNIRGSLDVARPAAPERGGNEAYGLLTLTPPDVLPTPMPRDLILLVDTSGSMEGHPLESAKRVLLAVVDSLTDADRLEMVEFSSSPRRWKSGPVFGTPDNRQKAAKWLQGLRASGGTEMASGVMEALRPLSPDSQRQVVLVSDGLIGSEEEIVKALLERLPPNCRFHALGVGSAANRSLTQAAARAGRGVELFVNMDEDAERAARRLIAKTAAPLVTELRVEGDALLALAPERTPDLYAQCPALLSVALRPEGGTLWVRGKMAGGEYVQKLLVPSTRMGEGNLALAALYGREAVEDRELRRVAEADAKEQDRAIEQLGLTFQISTRLTSWVAISSEPTVDPTKPTREDTVPQMLPYGMSAEGLGLRSPMALPVSAPTPTSLGGMNLLRASTRQGWEDQEVARSDSSAAPGRRRVIEQVKSPSSKQAKGETAPEKGSQADRDEAVAMDDATPSVPASPRTPRDGAAQRRLNGKIRRKEGQRVWIELVLTDSLEWKLPLEVCVRFADGTRATAKVSATQSTAPGSLAAGLVVRLVLELEASPSEPAVLELALSDGLWEVVL